MRFAYYCRVGLVYFNRALMVFVKKHRRVPCATESARRYPKRIYAYYAYLYTYIH